MSEALKGYPKHAWLAVGHLAEAEDELLEKYVELAGIIRDHRLRYTAQIRRPRDLPVPTYYHVPTLDLLDMIETIQSAAEATVEFPPSLITEVPA